MPEASDEELHALHTRQAIAARLDGSHSHGDLGDIILGAVDGTVTTFAIICGVAGTGLEGGVLVAFVLGLSNVIADGFSMAASNFLKARSDLETIDNYRQMEEMHIERFPEYEKEEIREIYKRKGFSGSLLEQITEQICSNKKQWVNTMLTDEWGLQLSSITPIRSAGFTFGAFILAGIIPLLPLLLGLVSQISKNKIFLISGILTVIVFLVTGAFRGKTLQKSMLKSAFETLFIGGSAALIAFFVGHILGDMIL